jgi:hypothetical protein
MSYPALAENRVRLVISLTEAGCWTEWTENRRLGIRTQAVNPCKHNALQRMRTYASSGEHLLPEQVVIRHTNPVTIV